MQKFHLSELDISSAEDTSIFFSASSSDQHDGHQSDSQIDVMSHKYLRKCKNILRIRETSHSSSCGTRMKRNR